MISTSLEPFPNQHGVFFWTAPTKIPCPIEIWILYVESKACHCPVSVKVSGFTRFFRHWEQDSLFNAFRDSRNCLEGSDFNGQAMDKQWHQKCGKLVPTILFFNRFRHYSTRQRCHGNCLTLKSPMKEPPDSSCWQINWISGNLSLTDALARIL